MFLDREKSHRIIEQGVEAAGFELVDVEFLPRSRLLRIFIDRPGGVSVDHCAFVSNHLLKVFAVEAIEFDRLEVSSPGLDRPLKARRDFERFVGQDVQIKTRLPVVGTRRNYSGCIAEVGEEGVMIRGEGSDWLVAWDNIDRARLVPRF